MLRQTPGVIDVACPKCKVASGTRCTYTYTESVSHRFRKAWRRNRIGETMIAFHHERHAILRDLPNQEPALRAWLFLHGDIFEE